MTSSRPLSGRRRQRVRPRRAALTALAALLLIAAAACSSSGSPASTATTGPPESSPSELDGFWVHDSVHALNVFLPDGNSDYWLGGFGTADGARTVITGAVPKARYWSFTMYPVPEGKTVEHIHDTQIHQSDGHYTLTIAASCAGISGTCVATTKAQPAGIVVIRLYVPVDLNAGGTGGVPLPTISYRRPSGAPISLTDAAGTDTIQKSLDTYRSQNGALPAELTKTYPPVTAVPVAVTDPPPRANVSHSEGKFNNPDNIYQHVRYTTMRGNLVVSAQAPTYQADSSPGANDLGRPADQSPQVRYWSLCIVLKDLHTGDCLRDSQVHFPAGSPTFTLIVSPTCPVAGYVNCLLAGPEPLQVSLAYRWLLPTPALAAAPFRGPMGLTAQYVARP